MPISSPRPPPPIARIRPRIPRSSSVPNSTPSTPAVDTQAAAQESYLQSLIRRRKFLVRAVAVSVLVASCAILGAQLKSTKQEVDERKKIADAAQGLLAEPEKFAQKELESSATPVLSTPGKLQASTTPQNSTQINGAISRQRSLEIAKQIALLEDRKALLDRQRRTFEAKIEMLRERRAKKEEMEARRAGQDLER